MNPLHSSEQFDIAIVGGGPAGAVAALTLCRQGRSVVLFEASQYDQWRPGETLSPNVRALLIPLGVAPAFDSLDSVRSHGIRSHWGQQEGFSHSFLGNPHGGGWHVDRQAFDHMLVDAAERAGTKVRRGTRVTTVTFEDGLWRLNVESTSSSTSNSVEAAGLIDATGRRSALRRQLGGRTDVRDRLVAVAVQYEAPLDSVGRYTLIESAAEGWWYSAPLPDERLIVMWLTDADLLDDHRSREGWNDRIERSQATRARAGDAQITQEPVVAAAMSHRLERTLGPDPWLAVGDAEMAVDPLSGSGIPRAIDTGVRGALALDRWLDGDRTTAEQYERDADEAFDEYLERRHQYYQLESRWSHRSFWHRRHRRPDLFTNTVPSSD